MCVRDAVKAFTLFIPCGLAAGFLIVKDRLLKRLGRIAAARVAEIEDRLRILLGL